MEFVSHLGKKLLLPGMLDVMLCELDMQNSQINDCWTCLKVRQSFGVPGSWKGLPNILQDTEKSNWQIANKGRTLFEISCFVEKFVENCWKVSCRLNMDAPMVQKNFGWLSSQWDASIISRVLEVAYNALPVYLGNIISFWGLWWSWRIDSYNYSFP